MCCELHKRETFCPEELMGTRRPGQGWEALQKTMRQPLKWKMLVFFLVFWGVAK